MEHSRIYIFGKGERTKYYISSADFMTRNTVRRVEVAAPVLDENLKERLAAMFSTLLSDNVKARQEEPDGTYTRVVNAKDPVNAQETFYAQAYGAAGREF